MLFLPPVGPSVFTLSSQKSRGPAPPVDLSHNPSLSFSAPWTGGVSTPVASPRQQEMCLVPPSLTCGSASGHLISQRSPWSFSSSFRGSKEPPWALACLCSICFLGLAFSHQPHPVLWEVIFCWRAPQCLLLCLRLTFVPD